MLGANSVGILVYLFLRHRIFLWKNYQGLLPINDFTVVTRNLNKETNPTFIADSFS